MEMTRKQFAHGVLSALAVGVAGPASVFGDGPKTRVQRGFSLAAFQATLNTQFRFSGVNKGRASDFLLVDVADRGSSQSCEQFTLVFLAPYGVRPASGTYDVTRSALGSMTLYLVASGSAIRGEAYYRADFNLLRP